MSPGGRREFAFPGSRAGGDELGEGRVVIGMVLQARPQDMQEFIHKNPNGLHASEWIFGPPLQMRIEPGKMRILLEEAQTGEVQQGAQMRSTLTGHRCCVALLLARRIGRRLDACQFHPLGSSLVAFGVPDLCQKQSRGQGFPGFHTWSYAGSPIEPSARKPRHTCSEKYAGSATTVLLKTCAIRLFWN